MVLPSKITDQLLDDIQTCAQLADVNRATLDMERCEQTDDLDPTDFVGNLTAELTLYSMAGTTTGPRTADCQEVTSLRAYTGATTSNEC